MSDELFSMPESTAPLIETLRRKYDDALASFDKHSLAQSVGVGFVPDVVKNNLIDARAALQAEEQRLASIGFR
jgi:hypothetical protein